MNLSIRLSIILLIGLSLLSCNFDLFTAKYSVSINQSTGGIISVSPQQTSFTDGDQITVTATPNQGYVFSYWGGNLSGTSNPANFKVTGNTTISAVFTPLQSTYTIAIGNSTGGTVSLSPNKTNYTSGEVVTVTAVPTTGYTFSSWGGDLSGTINPTTITVSKNTVLSASFAQTAYSIALNQTTGGTISLSPSKTTYVYGDVVTVTATPAAGYVFSSWGGDLSGTTNPMTLAVRKNLTISAVFAQNTYSITLYQSAGGTISLSPNTTSYNPGDVVTVTAIPRSGYLFSSWGGDLSGTTNPTTITVLRNMTISASFAQITTGSYTITVSYTTSGMISLSPHKTQYDSGDSVTITATPSAGYTFSSWGGNLSGSANPTTISVSGNMTISATFTPIAYTISLSAANGGTIALSPNKSSYTYRESVTVTATANAGYTFASWGGSLSGSANPTTISVSVNMTISATFTRNTYSITVNQAAGGIISLSPNNYSYFSGDSITVIATPSAGHTFSSWGGDLSGSTNPMTISVSTNMTISATFTPIAYAITLNQGTGGTISLLPDKSSYSYGESVTITATPTAGYIFSAWNGSLIGSTNPMTSTVSSNMTISATFLPAGQLHFSSTTYNVNENGGGVTISVIRTGGSSGTVGVSYTTSDGTATAGSDYSSESGSLSWGNGDTAAKSFIVGIIDDSIYEGDETFTVTLSAASGGASVGSPFKATITIIENELPPPAIQISPTSVIFSASSGGANPATQSVSISKLGEGTLSGLGASVSYSTSNDWLTIVLNPTTAPATLTIQPNTGSLPAGEYSAVISISSVIASNSPQSVTVTLTVLPVFQGLLIADHGNGRIVRINDMSGAGWISFGTAGNGSGQFNHPTGLAMDDEKRIYITDNTLNRIVRIDDMYGSGWTAFGSTGSGINQFNFQADVAFYEGRIYISDHFNHRIVRIDDMQGTGWTTLGSMGSGIGQFNGPTQITFDSNGRLYITDYYNNRIVRVDDFAGSGWVSLDGFNGDTFYNPDGIDVTQDGKIYISDRLHLRIVRVDGMTGFGWTSLTGFTYCRGLEVDHEGRIYLANQYNSNIVRIDNMTGSGLITYGSYGSGIGEFNWTNDLLLLYY